MKAQDEEQALEHMAATFKDGAGKLSGRNEGWVRKKVEALDALLRDLDSCDGPLSFLDLGVGDMLHWERWPAFGSVEYLGVDGCAPIIESARQRHPGKAFLELAFSDVVELHRKGFTWPVDCVVALDVLYHVPSDDTYEGLVDLLTMGDFGHAYVLVSYATDPGQKFDGAKGVGQPGYAWFPRRWREPEGWDLLHRADFEGGPQRQQLSLYRRGALCT